MSNDKSSKKKYVTSSNRQQSQDKRVIKNKENVLEKQNEANLEYDMLSRSAKPKVNQS